jgi:CRISPR system Cascade subunit CasA
MGLVWICGNTLFDTLMLNFSLVCGNEYDFKGCTVRWEQDIDISAQYLLDITPAPPQNRAELFTFPFRLVELCRDSNNLEIAGCNIWAGKQLSIANPFIEPMTLLKKLKTNQTGNNGGSAFRAGDYVPRRIDEPQQMWRDFSAILAGDDQRSPGVMAWIKLLNLDKTLVRLNTASITFKNSTAVKNVFSDSLTISANFLTELGSGWVEIVTNEVKRAEDLSGHVGTLAKAIAQSIGGSDENNLKGIASSAKELAYFRMDIPFREWLASIEPGEYQNDEDRNPQIQIWHSRVRGIIDKLGKELIAKAGPDAMVGREVKVANRGVVIFSAAKAYDDFQHKVEKTIPKKTTQGGI